MAIALLAGCGKKSEDKPAAVEQERQEEPAAEDESEEEPAAEEEVASEAKRPQPIIARVYDYVSTDDGSTTLVSYKYDEVYLSDESAALFPELDKTLTEKRESDKKEKQNALKNDGDSAKEMYADYPDSFYGEWEDNTDCHISRCDDKVMSYYSNWYSYMGGAHGMYGVGGYNYDVATGKEITVDMAFPDKQKLVDLLEAKLYADYPELTEEFDSFEAKNTFKSYASGEYDLFYTLDPQSVSFYFGPYTFASYAAGAQELYFTYDELDGVIDPAYIPDEDTSFVSQAGHFDLDGDGDLETISAYISYENGEESDGKVLVSIDDEQTALSGYALGNEAVNRVVKTSGGKMFLLVTAQVENDYKVTSICDVTKGKLKELDSVWMQSWGRVYDPDNYIFGDYEPVDPDALYLIMHSSANELKNSFLGLYPVENNWYSKAIKTYHE